MSTIAIKGGVLPQPLPHQPPQYYPGVMLTEQIPQTKNSLLRIYFQMQKDCVLREWGTDGHFAENNSCHIDPAVAVWYFRNYKPMFKRLPVSPAMCLLKGARGPVKLANVEQNGQMHLLNKIGLMYRLPFVRGHTRTSYLTSDIGIKVLQLFCNKNEEFAKFYDVYVTEKDEKRIQEYGIDHRLGLTIEPIAAILKKEKKL